MPKVHYYGKKTRLVGKTLFEILANLRNFGVNRMVVKQEELLKNPDKKCYYIVKKVEPVLDEKLEQGAIWAERIFNDAKVPELVFVDDETWHPDWQLIPKSEEANYLIKPEELLEHGQKETLTLLPKWMQVPPLMEVFLERHFNARRGAKVAPINLVDNKMHVLMHYNLKQLEKPHMKYKVAEDGEEPHKKINLPVQSLLFEQFRARTTNK